MEDPGRFFQLLNFALGKAGGGNAPLHPTKLFHQLLHLLVLHANPRGLLPHVRNELHLPSLSLKACRQKCDNSQQPALKSADKSRWLKGFQNKKLEFTSADRGEPHGIPLPHLPSSNTKPYLPTPDCPKETHNKAFIMHDTLVGVPSNTAHAPLSPIFIDNQEENVGWVLPAVLLTTILYVWQQCFRQT